MNTQQVKVYEERNSTYKLGEELHFHIPASVIMINPLETFLKFNVEVGATTALNGVSGLADRNNYFKLLFNQTIGASALIKELTISANGVVLEQLDNYNRLARLIEGYTDNSTMVEKKKIFEGADAIRAQTHNLLYQSTNTTGTAMTMKKIEVVLPLRLSGIFNNAQPFPSYLTNGLKVRILLENDIFKVLRGASSGTGAEESSITKAIQNIAVGYAENLGDYRIDDGGNPLVAPGQQGFDIVNTLLAATNGDAVNANSVGIEGSGALDSSPFNVGQRIVVSGGTPNAGDFDANGELRAIIDTITYAGGKFQIGMKNPKNLVGNGSINLHMRVDTKDANGVDIKPDFTLSDMELIVGTVEPTAKQLSSLESQVASKGYNYDIQTYRDFMINNNAGSTFISNSILCNFVRTKAILSAYEVLENSEVYRDNLASVVDDRVAPQNYQYIINNILVPNQKVGLSRYQRNRGQQGGWEQGHIMELEGALEALGYEVRDLTNIDGNLFIGRALSKYGHTFNMATNQGDLRLNVEFTSQNANLLYHNWVGYMKTIRIDKNGIRTIQ